MKMVKYILILLGSGALLVGCATNQQGAGGIGSETEVGTGAGSSNPSLPPTPLAGPVANGANGSVSRSNPYGAGASGLSP